ncbi:MAG: magnesium transporter [Candidatus Asgardarchaeia archaeon]
MIGDTPKPKKTICTDFIEKLAGLYIDGFSLLSGYIATFYLPLFEKIPWIFIMFPLLLTMRGDISGSFVGSITTGLHVGNIKPSIFKNTKDYYGLISAYLVVGSLDAMWIAVLSFFCAIFVFHMYAIDFLIFLFVALSTILISGFFSVSYSSALAFVTFKKSLNPDDVTYPVVSSVDDSAIALVYLMVNTTAILINHIFIYGFVFTELFFVILFYGYSYAMFRDNLPFKSFIKEVSVIPLATTTLAIIEGGVLTAFENALAQYPAILIILPLLMDALGDQSAIVASNLTTDLAIGIVKSDFKSIITYKRLYYLTGISFLAGTIMMETYGLLICITSGSCLIILSLIIIENLLSIVPLFFVTIVTIYLTFTHGLDPDHFTIPVLSSLTDVLATVLSYLIVTLIFLV